MTDKRQIRGGALLARALKEKGVDHLFTLAGGFCNPALEGFMECQMPVINCPHEQVAGHLADGHTRITRKPSVCLVGPEGIANAVPAMLEAGGERSPVIFVTGSSTLKRQGSGGFKEIDDVAIAAPLVKYSVQITDGGRISEFVDRAWIAATTGYPGPVHISQQQERLFASGTHFATDFRDIPFHSMFEGLGGHGDLVTKRSQLAAALRRAIASGKTACVNVKSRGVISPIVAATSDKRDKASIE